MGDSKALQSVNQGREVAAIEDHPLDATRVITQSKMILEVMRRVMTKGIHYGKIPGCPKPSLFKAGAEKIASRFAIVIKPTCIEDLSTQDERRFRVTSTAYSLKGKELGGAVGECSSNEEKYKWRRPVCEEEFKEADPERKREKWIFQQGHPIKKKQIRTESADLGNTILQMADKRGYVAVVRKVTAASDVFTQDIESLPPEVLDQADPPKAEPTALDNLQAEIKAVWKKLLKVSGKTEAKLKEECKEKGIDSLKSRSEAAASKILEVLQAMFERQSQ